MVPLAVQADVDAVCEAVRTAFDEGPAPDDPCRNAAR